MLKRLCSKRFVTAYGNVIEKDSFVIVPMESIHRDSRIYSNPECFIPERFIDNQFHQMAFLAFGAGQRGCIGTKFGETQSKIQIIELIRRYKILRSPRTEVPIIMDPRSKFIKPLNKIVLNFEKLIKN